MHGVFARMARIGSRIGVSWAYRSSRPPAHRRYLDEIGAGAERLGRQLDTLFDYAAFQAGRLLVEKVPLDARELLREVEAELAPALAGAGLGFTMNLPGRPLIVEADPTRLAQALCALVDNARKFTPAPGSVRLRAGRDGDHVRIEVQDTGIGIAEADQVRIFDPFFQVEGGATRSFGGAGLGLALARAIVLAHGGTLMVRSAPGRGATFTIVLPAAAGG